MCLDLFLIMHFELSVIAVLINQQIKTNLETLASLIVSKRIQRQFLC